MISKLTLALLLISGLSLSAQKQFTRDVLHLSNGRIVRGVVLQHRHSDSLIFQFQDTERKFSFSLAEVSKREEEVVFSYNYRAKTSPPLDSLTVPSAHSRYILDVLYLKKGKVLRGTVVKRPYGDSIAIKLQDNATIVTVGYYSVLSRSQEAVYVRAFGLPAVTEDLTKSIGYEIKKLNAPNRQSYFGISMGILAPVGAFTREDFKTQFVEGNMAKNEFCYAGSGFSLGMEAALIFGQKIPMGVAASIRFQTNAFENNAASNDYVYSIPGNALAQKGQVQSNSYSSNFFLAGYALNLPLDEEKKLFFDLKAMLGVATLQYANDFVVLMNGGRQEQRFIFKSTFGFGLEGGFRWVNEAGIGFGLKAGYTAAHFQDVRTSYNFVNAPRLSGIPSRIDANINNVNVCFQFLYCH